MNKKLILLIPVLIGVMFLLTMGLVSAAATTTLVSPVAGANYSGTVTLTATTNVNASVKNYNVTFWYNASGGVPGTLLATVSNTTDNQTTFTTTFSSSSLSDLRIYNFSAKADNGTDQKISLGSGKITIDNTKPVNTITLETDSLTQRASNLITWSLSDATSGVKTYSVTITSPNAQTCPTITETGTSGKDALVDLQTYCDGTYTIRSQLVDYAGNENNITKTFEVYLAGKSKIGSNYLGSTQQSTLWQQTTPTTNKPLGETGTNIAILLIIVGAFYLFFNRKK